MADIEKDCKRFYQLTGMLPPGKDEASIGQTNYERREVRQVLWSLFSKLEHQLAQAREQIVELQAIIDKPPKTADGVPVFIGDSVWEKSNNGFVESLIVARRTDEERYELCIESAVLIGRAYSTQAAAEAAQSEGAKE